MTFSKEFETLQEKLSERKAALSQESSREMAQLEERKLQKREEVKEKATDFHFRMGQLKKALDEDFEGFLNLGKDSEQIQWYLMPKEIADYFRPELESQPEKNINTFGLYIAEDLSNGTRQITLELHQQDSWYSLIGLSVTANTTSDRYSGSCIVTCSSPCEQQEETREAGKALREFVWGAKPEGLAENNEERRLESNIRNLDYSKDLLNFMIGEMIRQVGQTSE